MERRVERERAEERRLQVLYAQWLQLSGVLKADGSFDDAAYRAKVWGMG